MRRSYGKYIVSLLLFGTNGIVSSHIGLNSSEIVFWRTLIGSVLLLAVFVLTGGRFTFYRQKRQFASLALSGVATGLSWLFLYEAYQQIGVGMSSLAYYCGPVLVMALSPVLFRERLRWPSLAGMAAVLLGVVLVNGKALASGNLRWGLFCGAMSAVFYALMVIFNKKADRIVGLENAALQLFFSFLTVAAFVLLRKGASLQVAHSDWPAVLLLGVVNTGVGCWLYFSSIGRLPVHTVSICGYLEPLSAVVFSAALLNETMLPAQILGAALILGGAVFGEGEPQLARAWHAHDRRHARHAA